MNNGKESKVKIELRDNKGNLTAGDNSPINITNIINKTNKIAVVDILKDTDLHLGDNVHPHKYGFSYNPLNQAVYPQGVKGIIYFDKKMIWGRATLSVLSFDKRTLKIAIFWS